VIKPIQKFYLDTIPISKEGRVVCLGMFDGLHEGHEQIIRKAVSIAKKLKLKTCVQTFTGLAKSGEGVLYTVDERIAVLESWGVDEVLVLNYAEVKDMTAEDYMVRVIKLAMNAHTVICGFDYTFGRGGLGTADLLSSFCSNNLIDIEVVPELKDISGRKISTAWLKEALASGDTELASRLCSGRDFFYSGRVCKGKMLGRKMGFPTANLDITEEKFKVRRGVYVVSVILGARTLYGVANVGLRPTVEDAVSDVIETYIFDFDEDIYGAYIRTELLKFLRPETQFGSKEELISAVERNKIEAKEYLKAHGLE